MSGLKLRRRAAITWRKLTLVAAITLIGASSVYAQADRYHKTYFRLGFMLRAANVCNSKAMVDSGFALVGSPEYRQFSAAYPDTIKGWMTEGAESFNRLVMRDGIGPACRDAQGRTGLGLARGAVVKADRLNAPR